MKYPIILTYLTVLSLLGLPSFSCYVSFINQEKHPFAVEILHVFSDFSGYPLVNIQKTLENHHVSWENPL